VVLKLLYLAITSTHARGELNYKSCAQLVGTLTLGMELDLALSISASHVVLEPTLLCKQMPALLADLAIFALERLTSLLQVFSISITEWCVLKAITVLRDLLKEYLVLEVLTVSRKDSRRSKNAVSALLTPTITNKEQ
jgi:hypothetical protein